MYIVTICIFLQIPTKMRPSPSLPPTPARSKPLPVTRRAGSLEAEPNEGSYNEDYNYAYLSTDNLNSVQQPMVGMPQTSSQSQLPQQQFYQEQEEQLFHQQQQVLVEDAATRRQNSMKNRQASYQDDYYYEMPEPQEVMNLPSEQPALSR